MRILYIAHKPPVPNVDGGTFAMRQFADVLTDENKADAYILSTHKHPFTSESKNYFNSKFEHFENEFIHTEIKLIPFLLSLLIGRSYILQRFRTKGLASFLTKNKYDLIICDSLFSLYALDQSKQYGSAKIWLRSHNVEFLNWISLSKQQSFVKKWLYMVQAKQLKKAELQLISKTQLNLCISQEELQIFKKLLPQSKTTLFPIHIAQNSSLEVVNRACYFIGSNNWGPNIDTVNYLLECWQDENFQKHEITIAGGFNENYSPEKVPNGVKLIGRVENVEEFMVKHGILVAPSFSGSGIKVKILEALGAGVPVITTDFGAQGIEKEAGLIMVKNKEELLKAIERLKSDDVYFRQISEQGKNYIQEKHSFAAVKRILNEAFGN